MAKSLYRIDNLDKNAVNRQLDKISNDISAVNVSVETVGNEITIVAGGATDLTEVEADIDELQGQMLLVIMGAI